MFSALEWARVSYLPGPNYSLSDHYSQGKEHKTLWFYSAPQFSFLFLCKSQRSNERGEPSFLFSFSVAREPRPLFSFSIVGRITLFFFSLAKKPYSNWKIQKLKQTNWISHSLLQWLKPPIGTFKLQSRPNPLISSVSIFCNKNVGRRSSTILYLIELVWDFTRVFWCSTSFVFPWFCYTPDTNFSLLLQHV